MRTCRLVPFALMCLALSAVPLAAEQNVDLKVSNVTLFSSGVGFFERQAKVTDSATAQLQFRTAQINDILKSLVVQDLDGGTVRLVSYASQDPVAKTLSSFGVNLSEDPGLGAILIQLRGEPVEISGPRQLQGTIIGVETHEITIGEKTKVAKEYLNVLTDAGLQQLELGSLTGIKLLNDKVSAELNKALVALAAGHDADKKSVTLHFDGTGERRVSAAFLLEAPIWKTSYRLVLAADKKPFLQGWAIVENATQEDWKDVHLSLVSGRPISFAMDLYSPLYVTRPVEEMELYASLRPPAYAGGMGGGGGAVGATVGGEESAGRRLSMGAKAPAAAAPRTGKQEAEQKGVLVRRVPAELTFFGFAAGGEMSKSVQSVASAQEAGELFEYAIQAPVSIPRQTSAMLPIVNQEVAGEKVSIFNPETHPKHPLNGLMLDNTTELHLMQGPLTVFDGGVYAGDAKLPDVRAGEKRLIAYALDLGVEVMVETAQPHNDLVSVRIEKGTFFHRRRYLDERTYRIKNKDHKDRTMLIEQRYSPGWQLLEPKEPYERTADALRIKVTAPAGKTTSQPVRLEQVLDESVALTNLDFDNIQIYLRQSVVSAAVKEALQKVIALRTDLDRATRQRAAIEQQLKETTEEQVRIRENIKTLDHSTDAYTRQLKKFDALETAIESQREKLASARQEEETRKTALESYLLSINIE